MKRAAFIILVSLSTALLVVRFGTILLGSALGLESKSGIRIESNVASEVSLDKKAIGKTPFQKEDLSSGEHLIELSSDTGEWKGYVKLTPGTLTVVNRDLAQSEASSSGEIIFLEKGKGAVITSNPSGAKVSVDGSYSGVTPLTLPELSSGEHLFLISHPNFLDRSVRAAATDGYTLNLSMDLAVSEAEATPAPLAPVPPSPQVIVKQTPTGFLNVRDQASLNGNLVERVSSGDILTLEQEGDNWDKVKLPDNKEGYVAVQYVQKKSP